MTAFEGYEYISLDRRDNVAVHGHPKVQVVPYPYARRTTYHTINIPTHSMTHLNIAKSVTLDQFGEYFKPMVFENAVIINCTDKRKIIEAYLMTGGTDMLFEEEHTFPFLDITKLKEDGDNSNAEKTLLDILSRLQMGEGYLKEKLGGRRISEFDFIIFRTDWSNFRFNTNTLSNMHFELFHAFLLNPYITNDTIKGIFNDNINIRGIASDTSTLNNPIAYVNSANAMPTAQRTYEIASSQNMFPCAGMRISDIFLEGHLFDMNIRLKRDMDYMYLFNWNNVLGGDTAELIRFLIDHLDISWTEGAAVHKSDDGMIIGVYADENLVKLTLNKKKDNVSIEINEGMINNRLMVRRRRGELDIYGMDRNVRHSVSKELGFQFKIGGFPLSKDAIVDKKSTGRDIWTILDGENLYDVRKKEDVLSVGVGGIYLFNWNNVPGDDTERLIRFLIDHLGISWAYGATVRKSNDGGTIDISMGEHSVILQIDEKNENATIRTNDGGIRYLPVKEGHNKLSVYGDSKLRYSVMNVARLGNVQDDDETITTGKLMLIPIRSLSEPTGVVCELYFKRDD